MNDKPTPKREVAISFVDKNVWIIWFYATEDAVTEFEQFGDILPAEASNQYRLIVDMRFDFEEVKAYIEGYG